MKCDICELDKDTGILLPDVDVFGIGIVSCRICKDCFAEYDVN